MTIDNNLTANIKQIIRIYDGIYSTKGMKMAMVVLIVVTIYF